MCIRSCPGQQNSLTGYIVGFTAWSSSRDPQQVFILLEVRIALFAAGVFQVLCTSVIMILTGAPCPPSPTIQTLYG